jgi:hypothetical protein
VILSVLLVASLGIHVYSRIEASEGLSYQRNASAAGITLRRVISSDDLVVVRSNANSRDERFNTENNYENPIIFYVAGTKGWVLPADVPGIELLDIALVAGATYYINTSGRKEPPEVRAWLDEKGTRLFSRPNSYTIYRVGSQK